MRTRDTVPTAIGSTPICIAGEARTGRGFSTVLWLIDHAEQRGDLTSDIAHEVREHVEEAERLADSPASRRAVIAQLDNAARKGKANADLTETIKMFEQYGLRFLTADEIRTVMPQYSL